MAISRVSRAVARITSVMNSPTPSWTIIPENPSIRPEPSDSVARIATAMPAIPRWHKVFFPRSGRTRSASRTAIAVAITTSSGRML